jgi:glycerol kinase
VEIHTDQDLADLEAAVEAHIREEERTLLNELRRTLSPSDRTALGRAFTAESRNYAAAVRSRIQPTQ